MIYSLNVVYLLTENLPEPNLANQTNTDIFFKVSSPNTAHDRKAKYMQTTIFDFPFPQPIDINFNT